MNAANFLSGISVWNEDPGDKACFCNLTVQGGLFRPGNGFYYLSEAGAVSSLSVRLCPRKKSEKNADQKSM